MSEVKISALPTASTLTGSELVPVVQGGVTKQTTAQDVAALGGGAAAIVTPSIKTSGPISILPTDLGRLIVARFTVGAAYNVYLPDETNAAVAPGWHCTVSDGRGDASANSGTVSSINGHLILNQETFAIQYDSQSATFIWDGQQWDVI